MRSQSSGALITWLMLIPMITVPLLAMIGLPPASHLDASSSEESQGYQNPLDANTSAVGQSDYCAADDLFSSTMPTDDPVLLSGTQASAVTDSGTTAQNWNNPFDKPAEAAQDSWIPPSDALQGWDFKPRASASTMQRASLQTASARMPAAGSTVPVSTTATQTDAVAGGLPTAFGSDSLAPRRAPQGTRVAEQLAAGRSASPSTETHNMTWRSAVTALNELGIHHYHLEPGSRQLDFLFTCSYTPPDNPRVTHRFEAEAQEPLDAVHKVIQQVRQWRRTR